jgi:hypothetical protein
MLSRGEDRGRRSLKIGVEDDKRDSHVRPDLTRCNDVSSKQQSYNDIDLLNPINKTSTFLGEINETLFTSPPSKKMKTCLSKTQTLFHKIAIGFLGKKARKPTYINSTAHSF